MDPNWFIVCFVRRNRLQYYGIGYFTASLHYLNVKCRPNCLSRVKTKFSNLPPPLEAGGGRGSGRRWVERERERIL